MLFKDLFVSEGRFVLYLHMQWCVIMKLYFIITQNVAPLASKSGYFVQ